MNTRVKQNPYHTQAALRKLHLMQPMSQEVQEWISLTLLVHLDRCKRGEGDAFSSNIVSMNILIALSIGSIKKNRPFYDAAFNAFNAFNKANGRPDPVALTTGEYAALKACLGPYLSKVLPKLTWEEYLKAEFSAFESFKIEPDVRKEFVQFSRYVPD